jgi:hypothetical protein
VNSYAWQGVQWIVFSWHPFPALAWVAIVPISGLVTSQ